MEFCTLVVVAKEDRNDAGRIKRNVNNGFPATRDYNGANNLFNYGPGDRYSYNGNYGVNDPNGNVNQGRSGLFDQYGNVIGPNYNIRRPIDANYNLVNGNNNLNPNMVPIYSNFNGYKVPQLLGGNYNLPYGNGGANRLGINGDNYNLGGYDRSYNLMNGNMRPNFDLNVGNTNAPGFIDGNYRNFGFAQDPNYNSLNGGTGQGLRTNLPFNNFNDANYNRFAQNRNFPENSNLYQGNLGGFNSYPGLIQGNNDFSGLDPNSGLISRSATNGQNPNLNTNRTGLMDEKQINLNNGGVGTGTKNETVVDKGAFLGEKVV